MLKIGLGSPQYGSFTDPGTISGFASAVEAIGFDSLWVGDRALVPTQPRDQYPGGGPVPEEYRTFLTPSSPCPSWRTPPGGCASGPARSMRPSTPRSCWPVR
ncbi:hypothetical protein [Streptomyces phaeochromogenes]|uniref:hypothetical protein n=1 Tax=Streptomyces phaeochromogenes TaxID=1923 RepID=UPI0036A36867